MARERGEESEAAAAGDATPGERGEEESSGLRNPIPDLMRRLLGLGLSGFFLTEEALRKALGDTLPRDWTDFAIDQSARTREEFLSRLSFEIGRSLENVDLAAVLRDLLEGRTLEVTAQIRLGEKRDGDGTTRVRVSARDTGKTD